MQYTLDDFRTIFPDAFEKYVEELTVNICESEEGTLEQLLSLEKIHQINYAREDCLALIRAIENNKVDIVHHICLDANFVIGNKILEEIVYYVYLDSLEIGKIMYNFQYDFNNYVTENKYKMLENAYVHDNVECCIWLVDIICSEIEPENIHPRYVNIVNEILSISASALESVSTSESIPIATEYI